MQKTLAWVAVVAVILLVGATGAWWWINQSAGGTPSWLFSQSADSGTLVEQADGSYVLTLNGVDPEVVAFTDRPVRDAAIIDSEGLVQAWPDFFAGSAPNAVLVEHGPDGQKASAVLTLTSVTSNADTLTFSATLITDKVPRGLDTLAESPNSVPPTSFASVSLFIDAANISCSVTTCQSPVETGILQDLGYTVEPPQSAA